MADAQEQEAMNEMMQMLEATPDTGPPAGLSSLVTPGNDIPAKHEKLAILVSTGKAKEAIGVQLTHEQVKRLSDKEVEKYSKRQEAYIDSKTTESLIDSFLMLACKGLGMVVKIADVEKLQQELKNDYIINPSSPLLPEGLLCVAAAGWHWLMPPSSQPNTFRLRPNLSPTCWICTTQHHPRTPPETRTVIHSKVLIQCVNVKLAQHQPGIWQEADRNLAGTL